MQPISNQGIDHLKIELKNIDVVAYPNSEVLGHFQLQNDKHM